VKQVLQSLKSGQVELAEIPVPVPGQNQVLIQSTYSLVSLGTERMLLEFGKAGWLGKARMQPEKVRQVMQKLRTDGVGPTLQAVQNKLDRPIPLGYSNVGRVLAVGHGVSQFKTGDRIVSNGPHAELVSVSEHLCAKIPDNVSDTHATFSFVAAIGLQGVRLLEPTLGETIVVIGLGLIGLLSVQVARANGCHVVGFDIDPAKVALARQFGAESFLLGQGLDPVKLVLEFTKGHGCDGVLITASTESRDPVRWAPQMCRQRGRVSLVGVCDLDMSREDFYKKEIRFQVSCSYGPGRYDANYEQKNMEYPIGFVRWTEERNVQAILHLLSTGALQVDRLITRIVDFDSAPKVYSSDMKDVLGLLFKYSGEVDTKAVSIRIVPPPARAGAHVVPAIAANTANVQLGVIGAGNFTGAVILPIVKDCGPVLHSLCSRSGVSAQHLAKRFGFQNVSSDEAALIRDPHINTLIISTPHNQHARQAAASLQAGKHVFLEKPLAVTPEDLQVIEAVLPLTGSQFLVGFNRRFSSLIEPVKKWLGPEPKGASFIMTVNALAVDAGHWTQDRETGGGRLIGEGCHFVDLLRFLADSPIQEAHATFADHATRDTFSIHLRFASGALGVINYFANGHRDLPKERLEAYFQNQVVLVDNFKNLIPYGTKAVKKIKLLSQDKGHDRQFEAFFQRVREGGTPLIPFDQLIEVARWCQDLERGS
jgi:predicted dehydrogenase/threonine dehydrogenase-like Zn-dependent dehydrogenase